MEPWRAVDAHNGGVEAQIQSNGGSVDPRLQICITMIRSRIRIRIRIILKSRIRIRINVKRRLRIHITGATDPQPCRDQPQRKAGVLSNQFYLTPHRILRWSKNLSQRNHHAMLYELIVTGTKKGVQHIKNNVQVPFRKQSYVKYNTEFLRKITTLVWRIPVLITP